MSEYWIKNDGDVVFCDGDADISTPNHEAVVIAFCLDMMIDRLGDDPLSSEIYYFLESFTDEIIDTTALRAAINDQADYWERNGLLTSDQAADIYETLKNLTGLDEEIIEAAIGQHDDPRVLGVKFGWIRVINNNFDILKLDRDTCNRMYDFAMEESEYGEWNIEVLSHGADKVRIFIMGVPSADLGAPKDVLKHQTRKL